ncbi:hypothetical protein LZ30DRAFT_738457 [Colletotrichum cereale]|nr:hypothetical protein LZ30DRAFT_738457 [Colletotrichum cereale]
MPSRILVVGAFHCRLVLRHYLGRPLGGDPYDRASAWLAERGTPFSLKTETRLHTLAGVILSQFAPTTHCGTVLYFGVLLLQLRHGTWVLITWWRLLVELLHQRPTAAFSSFGAQGSYAVSILVLLAAGVALAGFGGVVLLFQVQFLLELMLSE